MAKYEVRVNGKVVWSENVNSTSANAFPPEYRARPESGEVELAINGVVVGVQRTLEADNAAKAIAAERARVERIELARSILAAEGVN